MSVYVDDHRAPLGRMFMCHMLADKTYELISMAKKIGVSTKWIQRRGEPAEHMDICLSKRALAVKLGAQECTMRDAAMMIRERKRRGLLQAYEQDIGRSGDGPRPMSLDDYDKRDR